MQRATWTDERLDDLARGIDRRLEQVDRRLDHIDDGIRQLTTTVLLAGGSLLATLVGAIATGALGGNG